MPGRHKDERPRLQAYLLKQQLETQTDDRNRQSSEALREPRESPGIGRWRNSSLSCNCRRHDDLHGDGSNQRAGTQNRTNRESGRSLEVGADRFPVKKWR